MNNELLSGSFNSKIDSSDEESEEEFVVLNEDASDSPSSSELAFPISSSSDSKMSDLRNFPEDISGKTNFKKINF